MRSPAYSHSLSWARKAESSDARSDGTHASAKPRAQLNVPPWTAINNSEAYQSLTVTLGPVSLFKIAHGFLCCSEASDDFTLCAAK